jgi:hypothetical protein
VTLSTLADLAAWSRGRKDLRGTFLTIGQEALWIPGDAASEELARTLRYFIGGLPADWLQRAAGVLRGDVATPLESEPNIPSAALIHAVQQQRESFVALQWDTGLPPSVTGVGPRGTPTGRLAPARVVSVSSLPVGDTSLTVCVADSACPEPTFEAPDAPLVRPTLRSVTIGPDASETQARAFGEALERYALGLVPTSRLRLAAARELDGPCLDPSAYLEYARAQCARQSLERFSPVEPIWWVQGTDVVDQETLMWIPAALVFAPFPQIPPWTNAGVQNSSGAAFHPTNAQAIASAWLELVERDAFIRAWRLPASVCAVPERDLPTAAAAAIGWIRQLDDANRVAAGVLASTTGVPVWAVFASGPAIGICIGAAAGDFEAAVVKAACECLCQAAFRPPAVESPHDVRGPDGHAGFYCFGDRFRSADRLFDALVPAPRPPQSLNQPAAPRGYVVELETPAPFRGHAVKAIDPGLIPMTFGFDAEPLARLLRVQSPLAGVHEISHVAVPHPFA